MSDLLEIIDEVVSKAKVDVTKLPPSERRQLIVENFQNKKLKSVDLVWSQTSISCCVASASGWLYGFMSGNKPCPLYKNSTRHQPTFIDNNFHNYKHKIHRDTVAKYRPKYCTVRDMMTREQCKEAGIRYYSPEKIIDWAYELKEYAHNVMIIPKDEQYMKYINPKDFMIGYSVPSSYGGTPMPISYFSDYKIHLLGGPISTQIALWAEMPDNVVSLDNNSLHLLGVKGSFWTITGETIQLQDLTSSRLNKAGKGDLGFDRFYNVSHVCIALSLGAVATYFGLKTFEKELEVYDVH